MERSESIVNLTKAMLVAQKSIGGAVKGSKNPFFKSNYADLPAVMEACKDELNNAGILVTQMLESVGGEDFLLTLLIHGDTGEYLGSRMKIYNHKDIQGTMSEQTYLRRYMLQAISFIPSVDDDGEGAVKGSRNEDNQSKVVKKEIKPELVKEVPKQEVKPEPVKEEPKQETQVEPERRRARRS